MRRDRVTSVLSAALVLSCATNAAAWVNPLEDRYLSGPSLDVCDFGSFFVGGVPKITNYATSSTAGPPQQIIIGQMYVQFMIPNKRHQWPLVMIHGSTHTGAALDATPDGREGWFPYAVRNNLATFVVDQPGRGRSGFDQSRIQEALGTNNIELIPTNWGRITDNGAWTTWFGHIIEGDDIVSGRMIRHGDPGDPDPPEDPANPSPAHGNYPPAYPIPPVPNSIDPKIEARTPAQGTLPYGPLTAFGAIGPAPNPANNTYLALEYFKQLVPNAEVTLPGSICPTCVPPTLASINTWLPQALAELVEGLGGAILSPHSQSTGPVFHTVRVLKERGKLHLVKGIIIPEGGGTDLAAAGLTGSDFDTIPFLLINGDYRPLATRQGNRAAAAAMNASPTRSVRPALVLDAEDPIFAGALQGHTHMGMLGTTSLTEFDFFLQWASTNIDNPLVEHGCRGKRQRAPH